MRGASSRNSLAACGSPPPSARKRVGAPKTPSASGSNRPAPFPGGPADRCLIWDTADPYLYLRTTADHRAIIGGGDEPFRDPTARDRLLAAKTRALKRRFRR